MSETTAQRSERINKLTPELQWALANDAMDRVTAIEDTQSVEAWVEDEQPVTITLSAADWFRVITAGGALVTMVAPVAGMPGVAVDTALIMEKIAQEMSNAKTPSYS